LTVALAPRAPLAVARRDMGCDTPSQNEPLAQWRLLSTASDGSGPARQVLWLDKGNLCDGCHLGSSKRHEPETPTGQLMDSSTPSQCEHCVYKGGGIREQERNLPKILVGSRICGRFGYLVTAPVNASLRGHQADSTVPIMNSSVSGAKPTPNHDPAPVKPTGTPVDPEGPPFDPGKWPKYWTVFPSAIVLSLTSKWLQGYGYQRAQAGQHTL
jgi:hypothetical protein